MRTHRCFAEETLKRGSIRLSREESHHLLRVLRAKPGDPVELIDGCGGRGRGELRTVHRHRAEIAMTDVVLEPPDSPSVHIAAPSPRGARLDWMIEKLSEIGVTRWWPLETDHSEKTTRRAASERRRRITIAAAKQCGRSHLMTIAPPISLEALARWEPTNGDPTTVRYLASLHPPESGDLPRPERPIENVLGAIGPEGGLSTAEERALLDAGFEPFRLSPYTLRVETAALALASWLVKAGSF